MKNYLKLLRYSFKARLSLLFRYVFLLIGYFIGYFFITHTHYYGAMLFLIVVGFLWEMLSNKTIYTESYLEALNLIKQGKSVFYRNTEKN